MTLQHWTFDDRDTEYLHYHPKGRWTLDGIWNASSVTDNPTGTLAWTNDLNATVKFTFPTPANAFYYYGMKRSNGGLYAICIDCDPYKPQYTFIDALDTQDKGDGLPVLLFARKFLDYGIHEIILENRNDTRVFHSGNSQLSIDRFEIRVQGGPREIPLTISPALPTLSFVSSTFSLTSSLPSVLSILSSSTPPSFDSDSPFSSSSPSLPSVSSVLSSSSLSSFSPAPSFSSTSTKQSAPVGQIVGGVIGALVLLCLLVFLFTVRRRIIRRSKPNTGSLLIPNSRSFLLNPYGTVQPTARDVEKLPKHKISAQEIISTRKVKLPPHGVLRSSRSRNPLFTSAQASTVRNDNLTVRPAHLPTALSLNNTVTDSGYPRQRPILIM